VRLTPGCLRSSQPTDLTMTDFWQEQEIQIIIRMGLHFGFASASLG
jgi:hypothetical protein